MQAIVFERAGEPAEVLRFAEVARPVARSDEVLVRVTARPIQPADLAFIRGQYRIRPSFPQVAGLEGTGVVIEGPRASSGRRVAFRWPGSWAEVLAVPARRLIEVAEDVPESAASQISLNPITAWALLDEAGVGPGDWLLTTAGASTVSVLVAAIAQRRGIHTIGVVRGNAAEAAARSPAEHLLSTQDPDLVRRISDLTGEDKVAALLDSVGGPLVAKLFATLTSGARIVAYGVQDREPAAITNAMLIYSNLTWKGFGIDWWLAQLPAQKLSGMVQELWSMVHDGSLALPVESTHPLADFRQALAADAHPGRRGKVLLV